MSLFDSLKDNHHHVGMDNLYNSVSFYRAAYDHERRVLCHIVTQKAGLKILPWFSSIRKASKSDWGSAHLELYYYIRRRSSKAKPGCFKCGV